MALLGLASGGLLLASAVGAYADGGLHVQGAGVVADSCASCHRVHTAQDATLLAEPQTPLCYTCHGSSATGANTDVQGGVGYTEAGRGGAPAPLRGGGFEYALIDSANPSGQQGGKSNPGGTVPVLSSAAPVTSSHSTDTSKKIAWGNGPISATQSYGAEISLRCGSCHDPHGNGNYRLLRPIPKESGSGSVTIADASKKSYTTTNYWQVDDSNAPGFIANISDWCSTCHTRYLSSTSFTNSGDAVFTQRHRTDQTSQGSANCIQCHVAHGSNASVSKASSGGVHSAEGVPAPIGGYLLRIDNRGVCQMCHEGE